MLVEGWQRSIIPISRRKREFHLSNVSSSDPSISEIVHSIRVIGFAYFSNRSASEQSDLSRANFFGAGPHACLGRPLSVEIWKGVTSFLSEIQLRASVLSYAPRKKDIGLCFHLSGPTGFGNSRINEQTMQVAILNALSKVVKLPLEHSSRLFPFKFST